MGEDLQLYIASGQTFKTLIDINEFVYSRTIVYDFNDKFYNNSYEHTNTELNFHKGGL